MALMEKIEVTVGSYWVSIPEANLYILCGCPADVVKHLMKKGLILSKEKEGINYESGPNAILLSDVAVQNGQFCNLAEFPVLQMLYRQGMLLPNYPKFGTRPILIGSDDQIKAQMEYILRGNYGLLSLEEIINTGISEKIAKDMMRLKLRFGFGKIRPTKELLEPKRIQRNSIEISNGVYIKRKGFNRFQFEYKNEKISINLNLKPNESYLPAYHLSGNQIRREYFSVIHSGAGDGWDINRPCMGSVLIFQGKLYLIDAGPNILHSLMALGIGVNEIEGIFHTHAHDDHFAGLTTLVKSDHRIKYFATPLVRASVTKKLISLMSIEEKRFAEYFDIHDLEFDVWNEINGLEVKPIFSPHPVETNIYVFRALWHGDYKTYAHYADIVSLDVLQKMITDDQNENGISSDLYEKVRTNYLLPVRLKKIDIGGGLIHGKAEDFRDDHSEKIILAHKSTDLIDSEKEIGSDAPFGTVDVLIPAIQDYNMRYASEYLEAYFPNIPRHELRMLLNFHSISFNAGSILIKKGRPNKYIFLILTGIVELINTETGINNILSAGSLIGELSGIFERTAPGTYRAATPVNVLQIPSVLYREFVKRNNLIEDIEKIHTNRQFFQNTWLFGEMISSTIQCNIAKKAVRKNLDKNAIINMDEPKLMIIAQGEVHLCSEDILLQKLSHGDFCGEETILFGSKNFFQINIIRPSQLIFIPGEALMNIPIIHWKLLQSFEKRMKLLVSITTQSVL